MACDICGKKGSTLTDLLSSYQTNDIKAICPECERIINKRSGVLFDWAQGVRVTLLKRFMQVRRESLTKGQP